MIQDRASISANRLLSNILLLVNVVILRHAFIADKSWYRMLTVSVPLLLLFAFNTFKKSKAGRRQV